MNFFHDEGSGKSFLLDELAKLDPLDLNEHCTNKKMQSILQSTVAVSITYNGITPVLEKENPIFGISARTLFSFYFTGDSSWEEFSAALPKKGLNLHIAVKCILHTLKRFEKTGVLLLVDELIKSAGLESHHRDLPISQVCVVGIGQPNEFHRF